MPARADASTVWWLATVGSDEAPHVRPILTVWMGRRPYFASGDRSHKSLALAEDGRCSLAVATDLLHIVVEGTAAPVDDPALLHGVADAYEAVHGWPVEVRGDVLHNEDPWVPPPGWVRAGGAPARGSCRRASARRGRARRPGAAH